MTVCKHFFARPCRRDRRIVIAIHLARFIIAPKLQTASMSITLNCVAGCVSDYSCRRRLHLPTRTNRKLSLALCGHSVSVSTKPTPFILWSRFQVHILFVQRFGWRNMCARVVRDHHVTLGDIILAGEQQIVNVHKRIARRQCRRAVRCKWRLRPDKQKKAIIVHASCMRICQWPEDRVLHKNARGCMLWTASVCFADVGNVRCGIVCHVENTTGMFASFVMRETVEFNFNTSCN